MAITDLLPGRPTVASTEKKLLAARVAVGVKRKAYHDALYAAQGDDPAANKAKVSARAALDAAEAEVVELTEALAIVRERETIEDRKRAKIQRAKDRAATLKATKDRTKAGAKIEQAAATLVEGWRELETAGAAIRAASPIPLVDLDLHGFLVGAGPLSVAVHLHLRKAGLDWIMPDFPTPVHELPTLLERLGRVDDILEQRLAEDAAADAPAE